MSAYTYHPPKLHKGGRVIHGLDGVTRRRCRICGHTVYGRNGGICHDCLSKRLDGNKTGKGVR